MTKVTNSTMVPPKVTNTVNQDDVKKLIKYVNNEALQEVPDSFIGTTKSAVGSALLFEGLPLLKYLKRNKTIKTLAGSEGAELVIKDAMKELDKKSLSALKNIFKGKDGSFGSRLLDYLNVSRESQQGFRNIKDATKAAANATKATTKGKNPKVIENAIKKATEKADVCIKGAVPKQAGKLGKLKGLLKSSGAGMMLIFSGISEVLSEVVPTFKELGAKKGLKQLGKSAVKVVSDTAGFLVGEQLFTTLGTTIGTMICPGIGTAVGAVVGFIGGMLGSFVAGKITKAVFGKSEREIAKEQTQQEQAKLIQMNTVKLNELKIAALNKIEQERANANVSDDFLIALQSLQNLEQANPFTA